MKRLLAALLCLTCVGGVAQADLRATAAAGVWTNAATWTGGVFPAAGDDVVVGHAVTLDSTTPDLGSFTNMATLTFVGTNTALTATNVTLNSTVTHVIQSDTNGTPGVYADWVPDNRVWIVCSNLTVGAAGSISVNGKGYKGGTSTTDHGKGPGASYSDSGGSSASSGASHGGLGGLITSARSPVYGDPAAPADPGSGAGYVNQNPTPVGGGVVRVEATGAVTVDGTVSANGEDHGNRSGGGAGGAVHLTCRTFHGSGVIRADGGRGGSWLGGGGGGGRVAVVYNTAAQAGVDPRPTVRLSAAHGWRGANSTAPLGNPGTIYVSDTNFFPYAFIRDSGRVISPGVTVWSLPSLVLSNAWFLFETNTSAAFAGDVVLFGPTSRMDVAYVSLEVGGSMTLTNGAAVYVWAAATNGAAPDYGALLAVTGALVVASNCWVYPYSDDTNGGSPLFRAGDLRVLTANAGFNADQKGYRGGTNTTDHGKGPGRSLSVGGGGSGGAGYGGAGGASSSAGGTTYGSAAAPVQSGSGSGYVNAGGVPAGGGLIRIQVAGTAEINGLLTANGGSHNNRSGGASGGGITIDCSSFQGSGALWASGGVSGVFSGGGGGGGRIAVSRQYHGWTGITNVLAGTGASAAGVAGTAVWVQKPAPPLVANRAATNISYLSANFNGTLSSTGTAETTVWMYWGLTDESTNRTAWSGTNDFGVMAADQADLTVSIGGLQEGTNYYYRFHASNAIGETWAPGTTNFATPYGVPTVSNAAGGATNVTLTSACLNGELAATGTSATAVSVYWGPADGGTNLGGWAFTNVFGGYPPLGPVTTNVTLPSSDTFYWYRYSATNAGGRVWANASAAFMAGEVSVQATGANAAETLQAPGTFTVSRASALTNLDVTVAYAIGGSAVPGADYTLSPAGTSVVLAAGWTSTTVVVNPIWDSSPEGAESVTLTLLPGGYALGGMNAATVSIADAVLVPGSNGTVAAGNWNAIATWSQVRPPIAGDDVYVNHNVSLTNTTPLVASLTVSTGRTLTCYGTNVVLQATDAVVRGTMTHAENWATATNGAGEWVMDHRVWVLCTNLTVAAGGSINADGKGFQGATNYDGAGYGPGRGSAYTGGGHGGRGGNYGGSTGGAEYDSATGPSLPGSGGGAYQAHPGDDGGGAIRIEALGTVTVNGQIQANGLPNASDPNAGAGGSGGSIWITCRTFTGAGRVSAAGNDGAPDHHRSAAGGGGRIAIHYDAADQLGETPPTAALNAAGGKGGVSYTHWESRPARGMPGTLYLTDTNFYPRASMEGGQLVIPGLAAWTTPSLAVSNGVCVFPSTCSVTVAGDVTCRSGGGIAVSNGTVNVGGNFLAGDDTWCVSLLQGGDSGAFGVTGNVTVSAGWLEVSGGSGVGTPFTVGGNLALTNVGHLYVFSGVTNNPAVDYGVLVRVAGDVATASNCWIYPYAGEENGGAPLFRMRSLFVGAFGGIDADNKGFRGGSSTVDHGWGPGRSLSTSGGSGTGGAGYGGAGGNSIGTAGGVVYGSSNAPSLPGSGSGYVNQGGVPNGGGLIRMEVDGTIRLDGTMTARGGDHGNRSGGGSGGAIHLRCMRFEGAGLVRASGGTAGVFAGGGGGGGRISVYRSSHAFAGTVTAAGGTGPNANGGDGTIVWLRPPPGSVFVIH